jgi:hypothetical protein
MLAMVGIVSLGQCAKHWRSQSCSQLLPSTDPHFSILDSCAQPISQYAPIANQLEYTIYLPSMVRVCSPHHCLCRNNHAIRFLPHRLPSIEWAQTLAYMKRIHCPLQVCNTPPQDVQTHLYLS